MTNTFIIRAATAESVPVATKERFYSDLRSNSKFFAAWKFKGEPVFRFNGDKTSYRQVMELASKELKKLGWLPSKRPESEVEFQSNPVQAIRGAVSYYSRKDGSFILKLKGGQDLRGSTAYTEIRLLTT